MELSVLVAKIIAIIYIVSGFALLIGQINFQKIAEDFNKSPALTFIVGFLSAIVGLILVTYHNIWNANWTVLITIISWFVLIGGLIIVIYPKLFLFLSKYYKHSTIWGIFMICFGLIFGYFGFLNWNNNLFT